MTANDFLAAIHGGLLDEDLDKIAVAIQHRQKDIAPKARDFRVGDKVRFKMTTRPQYMRGIEATVTGIRQTKITVSIDRTQGRYRAGSNIICPTSILEKI